MPGLWGKSESFLLTWSLAGTPIILRKWLERQRDFCGTKGFAPDEVSVGIGYCNVRQPVLPFGGMTTVSLKLPESLLQEVEQEAAARGVPKSAVIRDCLERTLRKAGKAARKVSCLDLMANGVGHFHGPADLSVNKKYLKNAVLADYDRRRKNRR
jgi:hypothetical protein